MHTQQLDEIFGYIQEQERDWISLEYNEFMERPSIDELKNIQEMSGSDFNALLPRAALHASRLGVISARQIITSTLTARVDIGSGAVNAYIRLDGPANRFIVHDGSNRRILIGNDGA